MAELLLELFSEEIPARMQAKAAVDLKTLVTQGLVEAGLLYEGAQAHATPRRLVLSVEGLSALAADTVEERKGPRVDAPQAAIDGFLKSTGVPLDQLVVQDDKKGKFYLARIAKKGRSAPDVIAALVPQVIRNFPWPKSMRWGAGPLNWVRPLHSILCCFDGEVVPLDVDGIVSGDTTRGHRFLSPQAITARHFAEYEQKLYKAFVVVQADARAEIIRTEAQTLAFAQGLQLIEDDALLREVAGLVEWPVPLMGSFSADYLSVPEEVVLTTIKNNQRCFCLRDGKSGRLTNRYILVANIKAWDGGETIIKGNDKVIAARLSDAKFFWDQDRKSKLEDLLPKLDQITFHAKLGTVGAQVGRISQLAGEIAVQIGADAEQAKAAARLAKADLVSSMVGEFPELQGVMGHYYAKGQGLDDAVAEALRDQYRPAGPSDHIPISKVAQAVALADKLDRLIGFWSIDEKPTGSKDPYALRRAALGVIRIIIDGDIKLKLNRLPPDLLSFFAERLKVYLREQGQRHDLIDAVYSLSGQDDLLLIVKRVSALSRFLETDDGRNLLSGVKRASNILRIEEKKDGRSYAEVPDQKLLVKAEEKTLFTAVNQAEALAKKAVAAEDFEGAMAAMAKLRGPVDEFFEQVTVNDADHSYRENRLKLLNRIRAATLSVADFSKVEGTQ